MVGAVIVRPVGDHRPASPNRYQYVVAAVSPATSAFTVWSRSGPVATRPARTIRVKVASVATCQSTVTAGPCPDPGTESAVGVTRVHSRTPPGNGSPEATPCWKTSFVAALAASPVAAMATIPATPAPRRRTLRRSIVMRP